ncbi:S24 family peptidase [Enterobacter asburiae]|nr:S24 family peptidase [Enterobacter asburiae]
MKMTWQDLVKSRMKELDITQEKLAEQLGKTQGAIGHWLNGRREPGIDDISNIMKVLGIDEISLYRDGFAKTLPTEGDNFAYAGPYKKSKAFPLISWISAGEWNDAEEPLQVSEIDDWYESSSKIIGKGFWLRVEGDSMTAPMGVSVPEGTLVLFDTGREPENGSLVIAKLTDSNEATFKKLILDGGKTYLKGLNPAWPLVEVNGNCRIIGVAVQMMRNL